MSRWRGPCDGDVRNAFGFLTHQYGYQMESETIDQSVGYSLVLSTATRRIRLAHDYREGFFYFTIERIAGYHWQTPQRLNRVPLEAILQYRVPGFNWEMVQPKNSSCPEAAHRFADLLKQYAHDDLMGTEWIVDLIHRRESPKNIQNAFAFLIGGFGYVPVSEHSDEDMYELVLESSTRKVLLKHDYRADRLEFTIEPIAVGGRRRSALTFGQVLMYYLPGFEQGLLQLDGGNAKQIVELNAELMRDYAGAMLRGEEWPATMGQ